MYTNRAIVSITANQTLEVLLSLKLIDAGDLLLEWVINNDERTKELFILADDHVRLIMEELEYRTYLATGADYGMTQFNDM